MKIHLLSDLHLETGPYELPPPDLDCDVIVAAGDIGNGTQGVEWLKTLNKPVVYVMGNHELWSHRGNPVDMFQITRDIRKSAEGSNVHFLENESVIIGDVRFIGCTLWTNLGGDRSSINSGLVDEAAHMNDVSYIFCAEFYENEEFLCEFNRLLTKYFEHARIDIDRQETIRSHILESKKWHPLVGAVLHSRSFRFIHRFIHDDMRDNATNQPGITNIVVSHHQPFFESLIRSNNITEAVLQESKHFKSHWKEPASNNMYKVAAYASNLNFENFSYKLKGPKQIYRKKIAAWLAGHLHSNLDYVKCGSGIRVCSNPRGRYTHPLTPESAAAMNFFGIGYTENDIKRSQELHKLNPYIGDNQDFDPYFVIDTKEGVAPVIRASIEFLEPQLIAILNKCKSLSKHCDNNDPEIVATIADKLREKFTQFDRLVNDFDGEVNENTKDFDGHFRFQIYDYWRYEDFENFDFDEDLDPDVMKSIADAVKFKIDFREFILSRLVLFKSKNLASMKRLLKAESKRDDVIPKKFLRTWDNDF